jgi:hypothetical protein
MRISRSCERVGVLAAKPCVGQGPVDPCNQILTQRRRDLQSFVEDSVPLRSSASLCASAPRTSLRSRTPRIFSKNNLRPLPANLALSLWMGKTVHPLKTKCQRNRT